MGYGGNAGAAAILYRGDNPPRKLRYHLGILQEHTTYEAESVGSLLAVHLLSREKDISMVSIGTDSQAVLQTLGNSKKCPRQYIANAVAKQISNIIRKAENNQVQLTMSWVSEHHRVEGNEAVDAEAKKAAEGHLSKEKRLPVLLRGAPLPHSISAIRQAYQHALKGKWRAKWEKSPRFTRLNKFNDTLPSNRFLKSINELSQSHSSIIIQLRSGHVPLNRYLHRIGKSDSASCEQCQDGDEMVQHFILECPAYQWE